MRNTSSTLKKSALFFFFDALSFCSAFLFAEKISSYFDWHTFTSDALILNIIPMLLVMSVSHLAVGLHESKLRENARGVFRRCVLSMGLVFLAYQVLTAFFGLHTHNITTVLALLGASALQAYWRHWAISQGHLYLTRQKILILGAGERAAFLPNRMRRDMDRKHLSIKGFLPVENLSKKVRDNEHVITLNDGESIAQRLAFLDEKEAIDVVVLALDKNEELPVLALLDMKMKGVEIVELEDFVEAELGQLAVEHMRPEWLLKSSGFNLNRTFFNKCNYIVNASLAFIMLLAVWPFMLAAIVAIYLDDGRRDKAGFLYRQVRIGEGNKPFEIIKFRSMGKDAEKNGAQWASTNDIRVTRVGNILRKYRIDELPQLINVIRGDMYFVGPRPERPQFVSELEKEIPFYAYRHCVKPGLTGWAQINYPYGASGKDSLEKLKFDLYYIKHHSFLLDVYVLIRTVEIVLFGKGR
ncbi:MAG: hypothetical protein CBC55_05235 [Gammaproteobacteria bacterium TMED95]|nr:MAG: hypothetical protein CBC55_05235 [Gammaproteobacteria bacterium TMED95]|tara:strand:+ start:24 stop:1430 length:1407 start_codon:yes stop_codon:yes gene_type:complete